MKKVIWDKEESGVNGRENENNYIFCSYIYFKNYLQSKPQ